MAIKWNTSAAGHSCISSFALVFSAATHRPLYYIFQCWAYLSLDEKRDRFAWPVTLRIENIRVLHENNACLYRENKVPLSLSRPTLCHKFLGAQPDMCAALKMSVLLLQKTDAPMNLSMMTQQGKTRNHLPTLTWSILYTAAAAARQLGLCCCCWARAQHSQQSLENGEKIKDGTFYWWTVPSSSFFFFVISPILSYNKEKCGAGLLFIYSSRLYIPGTWFDYIRFIVT